MRKGGSGGAARTWRSRATRRFGLAGPARRPEPGRRAPRRWPRRLERTRRPAARGHRPFGSTTGRAARSLCYVRRVRVLRPRVLSKSGYLHVRRRGSASLVAVAVSALTPSNACCSRWVADGSQCTRKAPSSMSDAWWRSFVASVQPAADVQSACTVELNDRMNRNSTRMTGRWRGG